MKSSTDIALTLHAICERLERIEALLADRDELVGVGEAAEVLHTTAEAVRKRIARGQLDAQKAENGRYKVSRAHLMRMRTT